jgi:pilus assembly protein CpaB
VRRISPGTMTAAIFAILIGLGGAYAVRQYLHKPAVQPGEPVAQPAGPGDVLIPVASNDLIAGRVLSLNDIAILRFSPEQFKKSEYYGRQYMSRASQINGRRVRGSITKGDLFATASFYPEGMGPGLSELLEPGYRAISVPIHNIAAVAGFARPGSMVDILFRSQATENGRPESTITLIEMAEVLAVGDMTLPGHSVSIPSGDGTGNVTLAVSAIQAKALKVVEGRGELSLILRSPNERDSFISTQSNSEHLTIDQLLGYPTVTRTRTMDIYQGGKRTTLTFQENVQIEQAIGTQISTPIAANIPLSRDQKSFYRVDEGREGATSQPDPSAILDNTLTPRSLLLPNESEGGGGGGGG